MWPGPSLTSYDEIPYTDHCFPDTHPDYLATLAILYGLSPPEIRRCRVLELGCAAGGNLIPMAWELPEARFVGIDLSSRQIGAGQKLIQNLGLTNIDLRAMSLTEVDKTFGHFDFIVCHGVYSWVPDEVSDKILRICSENLAPQGIAYVSYNTYPGWHGRGLVRELMAYHVRGVHSGIERVQLARNFLENLVQILPDQSSSYARILRNEGEFLQGVENAYLYHEHLEETNHPIYFHEFIARAQAQGLQFLAEARTPGLIDHLPAAAREVLAGWAKDDMAREQYLDFLCNRTFRRTLLCHAFQKPQRIPSSEPIASLSVSTSIVPTSDIPDVTSSKPEEFRLPEGSAGLTTNDPIAKAALVELSTIRPAPLSYQQLCERIRLRLGQDGEFSLNDDDGGRRLRESLLRCFLSNLVALHMQPPRFTTEPNATPLGSPLARIQAEQGNRVTNLRRRTVILDEFEALLLRHLDGTCSLAQTLETIQELVMADEFTIYDGETPIRDSALIGQILADAIDTALQRLCNLALIVRDDESRPVANA